MARRTCCRDPGVPQVSDLPSYTRDVLAGQVLGSGSARWARQFPVGTRLRRLTRCTTAQLPAERRAVLARGVGMRTGDLTASIKAPGWLTTLRQPEGSGSPAEPGTQAGRVTREPAARGRRADPAAPGWWFHAWSVRRPHRRDLGRLRGLGVEINRAGQGRPMRRAIPGPRPR